MTKNEKPDLYTIKLGETIDLGPISLTRVPGGWTAMSIRGMTFIPFNNEFMPKEEADDSIPF